MTSIIITSDVNIDLFVNPDIESWNSIKIRISDLVRAGIQIASLLSSVYLDCCCVTVARVQWRQSHSWAVI